MKLVKQNNPLGNTSLMNWFFDDVFTQNAFNNGSVALTHRGGFTTPKTNIIKNEESFTLEIAAPGLEKEDFKLDIKDNVLSISAEHSTENKSETINYRSREFNFSSFQRSFTLPEHTHVDHISAEYKNGILSVVLPINEEKKNALQIAVQ